MLARLASPTQGDTSMQSKSTENRIRRLATKHGCRIHKSRSRTLHFDNHGEYRLVDAYSNTLIMGDRFDATLGEIEGYLTRDAP